MTDSAIERIYEFGISKGVEFFPSAPCVEDNIRIMEREIGFPFPESYRSFLRKFGTLSFEGIEFFGVPCNKIDSNGVPNAFWLTIQMRDKEKLPDNLLIIEFLDDGFYACIKLSDSKYEEAPVLLWYFGQNNVATEDLEFVSDSFESYFAKRVNECIDLM